VIKYGHLDTSVTIDQLRSINFSDYFQCYQQTSDIEKYYTQHNSSIWQMFDDDCPAFIKDLVTKIPQDFKNHVVSVISIDPGQTIPYHVDKHYMLKKQFGEGESFRYLIFLEDWKSGHYFEGLGVPTVQWRAGDTVEWTYDTEHMAANMGTEPRYTLQVTGHV
jgi:hypothetical protein